MPYILSIESSCDDTSAAVLDSCKLVSNVIASQKVHEKYGGVVPEFASRAHQQNIVPVVDTAIKEAGISLDDISAIAFTRGPGLLGSLLVGISFAKSLAWSRKLPLIEVDHLEAHVLSRFIDSDTQEFPYLCLLVSGGHTQILRVNSPFSFEQIGGTIDDAAGETIDKAAKIMGLGYPGGPIIDEKAANGDPSRFSIAKPRIRNYDYSFSGLKTSFLYLVRDALAQDSNFIENNLYDLCACVQHTVVDVLLHKLRLASKDLGIKNISIGGGVSANSLLRQRLSEMGEKYKWNVYIPPKKFTTDNAAMVGIAAYFKYKEGKFASLDAAPFTKSRFKTGA